MSSKYDVAFDPAAIKDLEKIKKSQPKIARQIANRIDALSENILLGKALQGSKKEIFSLRQGDYRVIYEIFHQEQIVLIHAIGDRKEVYK